MEVSTNPMIYQLFVTLLDGKTLTLNTSIPQISGAELKYRISKATGIPTYLQRLATGTRHISEESTVSGDGGNFPTVSLALRLRGGKGGFGSLLRGAGSKAWQKKTSNFDACRDMSGRRLRHVNAERRLEEWREAEAERRLERKAEDFLKKAAKKGKKGVGDGEAEKYVAKYREESERCVSEVLDSVKAAVKGVKRKDRGKGPEAKRLKIWTGKRKQAESDSDDSDEEEEEEKSAISDDNDNRSDSSKDAEGSSDSVTDTKQDGNLSGVGSSGSGSEEEKEKLVLEVKDSLQEHSEVPEPAIHSEKVSQAFEAETVQQDLEKTACDEHVVESVLTVVCEGGVESALQTSESHSLASDPIVKEEEAGSSGKVAEPEIPLNFDHFNSASELENLGLERLKSELQDRGLKCGGTLQERAARLFLLKSTPVDKLPKKFLAKK